SSVLRIWCREMKRGKPRRESPGLKAVRFLPEANLQARPWSLRFRAYFVHEGRKTHLHLSRPGAWFLAAWRPRGKRGRHCHDRATKIPTLRRRHRAPASWKRSKPISGPCRLGLVIAPAVKADSPEMFCIGLKPFNQRSTDALGAGI